MTEEPLRRQYSSDFSSAPFYGTSLFGLRAFKVDHTAHLKAIGHEYTWVADLNVARCMPSTLSWVGLSGQKRPDKETPHEAWLTCQCGFYAYVDGTNSYFSECNVGCGDGCNNDYHRKVAGVVEAWGRMIIGSRGFRAQYARIRGLVLGEKFAAVAKHYPVPVFASVDELVAEFPLTPTDGLAA